MRVCVCVCVCVSVCLCVCVCVCVSAEIFAPRHCIVPLIGSNVYSEQQTDKDAVNYQYFYNMFRPDCPSPSNSTAHTKQKIISEKVSSVQT